MPLHKHSWVVLMYTFFSALRGALTLFLWCLPNHYGIIKPSVAHDVHAGRSRQDKIATATELLIFRDFLCLSPRVSVLKMQNKDTSC